MFGTVSHDEVVLLERFLLWIFIFIAGTFTREVFLFCKRCFLRQTSAPSPSSQNAKGYIPGNRRRTVATTRGQTTPSQYVNNSMTTLNTRLNVPVTTPVSSRNSLNDHCVVPIPHSKGSLNMGGGGRGR